MKLKRGELLKCFSKEALCGESISWLRRSAGFLGSDLYLQAQYHDENKRQRRLLAPLIGTHNAAAAGVSTAQNTEVVRPAGNDPTLHHYPFAAGVTLSAVRKEGALLANQLCDVAEAYINANRMNRKLKSWRYQTYYRLLLIRVIASHRHNTERRYALHKLLNFALVRAIVRLNAHKVQYIRFMRCLDHMIRRRADCDELCELGQSFHEEQCKRSFLFM